MSALKQKSHQEVDQEHSRFQTTEALELAKYVLEKNIAFLENGSHALTYSSGLAACCAVAKLLCPGDEVLVAEDIYGGSSYLIENILSAQNLSICWVDTSDLKEIEKAISNKTKLLWLESPSNPLLRLADIAALAKLAKEYKIITVADNTLATPCVQKPLDFGIDIVLHTSVKYLSGYIGISGGALVTSRSDLFEQLQSFRADITNALEPFDCFCVPKGMYALASRIQQQEINTQKIANFLNTHESVLTVNYPGLPTHPQHDLACTQILWFGNLLTFELKGGTEAAYDMIRKTRLFSFYEKMARTNTHSDQHLTYRSTIAHAKKPAQVLARYGGSRNTNLVRLIVGPENTEELIHDLRAALMRMNTN